MSVLWLSFCFMLSIADASIRESCFFLSFVIGDMFPSVLVFCWDMESTKPAFCPIYGSFKSLINLFEIIFSLEIQTNQNAVTVWPRWV